MHQENTQTRPIASLRQTCQLRGPRECSKKSAQQGRNHFDARSVHAVREHSKMARTPLEGFFNIPILQCLSLVTQVIKKKRGICSQIPRSRALHVFIGLFYQRSPPPRPPGRPLPPPPRLPPSKPPVRGA